jgi:hypothetical protein
MGDVAAEIVQVALAQFYEHLSFLIARMLCKGN